MATTQLHAELAQNLPSVFECVVSFIRELLCLETNMRLRKVCCVALIAALATSMGTEAQAGGFLKRLFGKQSAECCEPAPEPVCCEPEPEPVCCCEPAPEPVCCEPAPEPVCCEPTPEPVCCEPAPAPEPCCAAAGGAMPSGLALTVPPVYSRVQVVYARPTNHSPVMVASNSYPVNRTSAVAAPPKPSQSVRFVSYR